MVIGQNNQAKNEDYDMIVAIALHRIMSRNDEFIKKRYFFFIQKIKINRN